VSPDKKDSLIKKKYGQAGWGGCSLGRWLLVGAAAALVVGGLIWLGGGSVVARLGS
jgi:hypothetical protein